MWRKLLSDAEGVLARKKHRRAWRKAVTGLVCAVVFCTTYALILPAVTLENSEAEFLCGMAEHTHTAACYETELVCQPEDGHVHSESCYEPGPELICDLEEHTHTDACYLSQPAAPGTELTMEEQARVDQVAAQIAALPTEEEIGRLLSSADENSAEELEALRGQAALAYAGYADLEPRLQEQVANRDALLALEWLWSAQQLEEPQANPGYVYDVTLADGKTESMIRIMQYAAATEGSDVTITISDRDGHVLDDSNGTYDVTAGEPYNVKFVYEGNKLERGKYFIAFTATINDFTQSGTLSFKDNQQNTVDLGDWYFVKTSDGQDYLVFNITEDLHNHSNISLVADVACTFDYKDDNIDFDGDIDITVKPGESTGNTEVNKWAEDIVENNTKVKWGSELYGHSNSQIVGSTITDTIITPDTHYYSDTDKENGVTFYARQYTPGAEVGGKDGVLASHRWKVTSDTQGMNWTATGWEYTMPETVYCLDCEENVSLGDAQWFYSFSYTSTVKNPGATDYTVYENKIAADGDTDDADITTGLEKPTGSVIKNGHYNHVELTEEQLEENENNPYAEDTFVWDITGTIPAAVAGKQYICTWRFYDGMTIGKSNQSYEPQDLTVTATIGDQTYTVYDYHDSRATESPICYRNTYTSSSSGSKEFTFYCKCTCTASTCGRWSDREDECDTKHSDGWCECWNITEKTTINFHYSTAAGELTQTSGGQTLVNNVELGYTQYPNGPEGEKENSAADRDDANVKIPGLFTKVQTERPEEDNGLLAEYAITVNEGLADLHVAHQEVTIVDTMSKTLNFVPSTLKVTRTDAQGKTELLENGTHYTVTYDTTKDENHNILTIVLNENALGPYQYTLVYDASVRGVSGNQSTYQNTATIDLFGETRTVDSGTMSLPSAAASAETYSAELVKTFEGLENAAAGELPNATFELYQEVEDEENRSDIYMATYTTDGNGHAQIITDTTQGVIFNAHVLYYLVETEAPEGYKLDTSKHYFWFCDSDKGINCTHTEEWSMPPYDGQCIYSIHETTDEDWNHIELTNEKATDTPELPNTGGAGAGAYTLGGLALMAGAALWGVIRRKKGKPIG